jgi:hypothetical protein
VQSLGMASTHPGITNCTVIHIHYLYLSTKAKRVVPTHSEGITSASHLCHPDLQPQVPVVLIKSTSTSLGKRFHLYPTRVRFLQTIEIHCTLTPAARSLPDVVDRSFASVCELRKQVMPLAYKVGTFSSAFGALKSHFDTSNFRIWCCTLSQAES